MYTNFKKSLNPSMQQSAERLETEQIQYKFYKLLALSFFMDFSR